jgi:hypothetical protein
MSAPDAQFDLTAREIVAWLFWYRSQVGTGNAAEADREQAARLFEMIYVADPAAVPGALQPVLAGRRVKANERIFASSPFTQPAVNVQEALRRSAETLQATT